MGLFRWLFGRKRSADCPVCEQGLTEEAYEGVTIDRCGICGGTWLDEGELDTIVETREKTFSSRMVVKLKVLAEWKVLHGETESDRRCPRCTTPMRTANYQEVPGLQIEKCAKNCGVWLDRNELEKIQVYEENR